MCNKAVIKSYACVGWEEVYVDVSHGCMHVIVVRAQSLCVRAGVCARARTRKCPQHAHHTQVEGRLNRTPM